MYHYFETLRVSKYHFLKGLTILRPWQERGVEATFLPQNFLKMFGNNEASSIFFVLLHLHGSCDLLQRRRSCRRRITQPEQWCRQPWSSPWWVAPRWVSLDDLSVSRRCTDRSCQTRVAADLVEGAPATLNLRKRSVFFAARPQPGRCRAAPCQCCYYTRARGC